MNTERINLYEALTQMKEISREGGTFSFSHRKYDRQRDCGGDLTIIQAARLRPKAGDEQIADASHKLFYTDTENGRAQVCWQCLVVEFNGKKVTMD